MRESTANGCISNVLHSILPKSFARSKFSAGELFTAKETKEEEATPPRSPCLVARLMGLETMPTYAPKNTMARSRSTNSVDNWNGFLCSKINKHKGTRSFREEPTFIRKENDGFLVLSFTPHRQLPENNKEFVPSEKMEPIQVHQRCKGNKESKRVLKQRKEQGSSSLRSVCDAQVEGTSRESSPVSVLHHFPDTDIQLSPISEECRKPRREKPSRQISSPSQKRERYTFRRSEIDKNSREEQLKTNTITDCNKIKRGQLVLSNIWTGICMLTEQEVKKSNLNFTDVFRCSEFNQETAVVLAENLLDRLLSELLKELIIL